MNNQWKSWNTERGNFSTLNRYLEFTYICTCHWKQCSLLLSSIVKLWTSQWGSNQSYNVNLWTATKGVLPAVSNIKKPVFILLLIIYGWHYCSCENRRIPFNLSKLQDWRIIDKKCLIYWSLPVGGRTLSTNINIAFSALSLILLRIT
jgi:hypothetical protein